MIKNNITISVIIPAHNSESSIKDAVDSVFSQTNQDSIVEIIIINDGSNDKTSDIVKNIIKDNETEIEIILIEQDNKGVSSARNKGIIKSKGSWVALLDSDDKWLPEKIEKQINAISMFPEILAIGSNRDNFKKARGQKISKNIFKLNLIDQLWSYWPSTPTLLFHKESLIELGMYDDSRTHAEDGDLLLKFTAKYGVYYLYDLLLETADKPAYGHSGLSSNNKAMHIGSMQNVKNAYMRKEINAFLFVFFSTWENIKYLRRIIITKLRQSKKGAK